MALNLSVNLNVLSILFSCSRLRLAVVAILCCLGTNALAAEDRIELETTTITGNAELPKILYVVPWQDVSASNQSQQKLTLHSLFGDLFEPQNPEAPRPDSESK